MLNPTMIRVLNGAAAPSNTEDPDFFNLCRFFADYQQNQFYNHDDSRSFAREGFIVGSPWHGDALNATVLFIGSNPGLTKGCLFPRWHPDGSLTLDGRRLMARVLSTEVVPFGSADEKTFSMANMTAFGINKVNALNYCWDNFTVPLMTHSAVRIVFLVGTISQVVYSGRNKIYQNRHGEKLEFVPIRHLSAMGEPDYLNAVQALHALGTSCPKV